jgi:hypothetical protein
MAGTSPAMTETREAEHEPMKGLICDRAVTVAAGTADPLRQIAIFISRLKLIWPVQSLGQKYSSFVFSEFMIE